MSNPLAIIRPYRVHVAVALANIVFAATFVALGLSQFHQPRPHGLPVAIVAPPAAQRQIGSDLEAALPDGFALRSLPDASAARRAIRDRRVDGALVVTTTGLKLLTADAGGNAPAQAITRAFTSLAARTKQRLRTADVVPPLPHDSEGLSPFFLILCVLFPSLGTGIVAGHALRRTRVASRLALLVAVAVGAGAAAAGIGDAISGLGHYWAIAGVVALFSLAISAPTAALGHVRPHLVALCVLAFLLIGIPASGGPGNLASFGPGFLRALHAGLPLGIAADTVRNTVYFGSSDTTGHLFVLAAYALAGVAMLVTMNALEHRRRVTRSPVESTRPLEPVRI